MGNLISAAMPIFMSGSDKFDLLKFIKNLTGYFKDIGNYLMIFAGVVMLIVAVVQIAKGLAGGGRGQVNWVMSILCLLVGGILIGGGWNLASKVANIGAGTIEELGTGSYHSEVDGAADGGGISAGFGS